MKLFCASLIRECSVCRGFPDSIKRLIDFNKMTERSIPARPLLGGQVDCPSVKVNITNRNGKPANRKAHFANRLLESAYRMIKSAYRGENSANRPFRSAAFIKKDREHDPPVFSYMIKYLKTSFPSADPMSQQSRAAVCRSSPYHPGQRLQ